MIFQFRKLMQTSVWRITVSIVVGISLWEILVRFVDNPLFLSSLSEILQRSIELWQTGELQTHIWVSFLEFMGGFALSTVVGIVAGVALAAFPTARVFLEPWISMLYATPMLALGPLFILALGIGITSKIAIVFLMAVFPILINTLVGLTTTDRILLDVAKSLGATRSQIYSKVRVPAAIPFIIAGLRLSVARALVGVVVAELFGARAGLGFLIMSSSQSFDTPAIFVGVIIFAIAGVLSVSGLKLLERRLAPWRFQEIED